jgi:tripartite-type tricarboxylate transporter receptor subunit TctC
MSICKRVLALTSVALLAGSPAAQAWPEKPVRFIVNFPAGGGVDIAARLLGEKLAKTWANPVVVENRPGAGGGIGAAEAARAAPDGHTLLFTPSTPITALAYLPESPPYSPQRDFTPVTNVAQGPMVLVVASASPFNSVAELIQAAKTSPGKLSFGHGGTGSQPHVAAENFAWHAAIDVLGVPYRGATPGLAGLIAGDTDFFIATLASAVSYIHAGRLRALGVTSKVPAPQLRGVPPIADTLAAFETLSWYGILAPKATPEAIVQKIHRDTKSVLQAAELAERYFELGLVAVANTPAEFASAIREEMAAWSGIAKGRPLQAR